MAFRVSVGWKAPVEKTLIYKLKRKWFEPSYMLFWAYLYKTSRWLICVRESNGNPLSYTDTFCIPGQYLYLSRPLPLWNRCKARGWGRSRRDQLLCIPLAVTILAAELLLCGDIRVHTIVYLSLRDTQKTQHLFIWFFRTKFIQGKKSEVISLYVRNIN